jgi:hypothetical protein
MSGRHSEQGQFSVLDASSDHSSTLTTMPLFFILDFFQMAYRATKFNMSVLFKVLLTVLTHIGVFYG